MDINPNSNIFNSSSFHHLRKLPNKTITKGLCSVLVKALRNFKKESIELSSEAGFLTKKHNGGHYE